MKLTESQLRKLVKEEIDTMVDEGLMDFIKSAGGKAAAPVAKMANKAKEYGKGVVRAGKLGSLAADLEKSVERVEKLIARLSKLDPELRSSRIVQALGDMKKRAAQLRAQKE
tara:strand:- start:55 stop:390 length:336 start_codon:yes stop_codon:yes gene_type:complete